MQRPVTVENDSRLTDCKLDFSHIISMLLGHSSLICDVNITGNCFQSKGAKAVSQ